jgi:hypothetical protein
VTVSDTVTRRDGGAVLAVDGEVCLDAVSRPDAAASLWPKLRVATC